MPTSTSVFCLHCVCSWLLCVSGGAFFVVVGCILVGVLFVQWMVIFLLLYNHCQGGIFLFTLAALHSLHPPKLFNINLSDISACSYIHFETYVSILLSFGFPYTFIFKSSFINHSSNYISKSPFMPHIFSFHGGVIFGI